MAIKNQDGHYVKVDINRSHLPDFIALDIYRDQQMRHDGPGPFDQVVTECVSYQHETADEMAKPADATKSIQDNTITACYNALKRMPRFAHWEDC